MLIDKELISVPEFLRIFSIGRTSFYEEIACRRLRIIHRGRRTFVTREDAQKWFEKLTSKSAGGVA